MDASMQRALARLSKGGVLTDRDDDYLPARQGVWAGGAEETYTEPPGPAFRDGAPLQVLAVRMYLSEEEMLPTVWLGWYEARAAA